ncbi:MAG TPA: stalk domain-containing protein, partial [Caldisericia bacterium]|nr:stalk domain-containing protein [Caldisericia bacterium]
PFGEKLVDYSFSITSDAIEKISKPGQEVSFNLTLNNKGAKDDSYDISIVSDVYDWKVTVPEKLNVLAQGKIEFEVKVLPPSTAKIGDELKIDLLLASNGDSTLTKTISLKVILATRTKILIEKISVNPGSEFEIKINVNDAANLYGFGFTLKYNKEYLDLIDVVEGDFLKKDGVSTLFLKNIDKEKGEVIIGVSRTSNVDGVSGDGTLLIVKFKALKLGKVKLEISDVVLKDPELNQLKFNLEIYEIEIYPKKIVLKLQIGNKTMWVNDNEIEIDVPPQIVEGRTLLPIRWAAEPLGAEVGWDGDEKKVTVTLKDTTIELWIGKSIAKVNGVNTPIDPDNPKVVPMIINGRTMLPVRFVAENLGCKVDWDQDTKTVTITYPKD